MSEKKPKQNPSQFPKSHTDIFRLLVLSDQQHKKIKWIFIMMEAIIHVRMWMQ